MVIKCKPIKKSCKPNVLCAVEGSRFTLDFSYLCLFFKECLKCVHYYRVKKELGQNLAQSAMAELFLFYHDMQHDYQSVVGVVVFFFK